MRSVTGSGVRVHLVPNISASLSFISHLRLENATRLFVRSVELVPCQFVGILFDNWTRYDLSLGEILHTYQSTGGHT